MIPAIILAAGASSRMGRPKAMLLLHGVPFIVHSVRTLRAAGVSRVVVVVRPGADEVTRAAASAGADVVVNDVPQRGQLSSLLTGLEAADGEDIEGVLVTLVDVPLVKVTTVTALLDRARAPVRPILRAVHQGRHGHPVIFMRPVFEALRRADPAAGAKAVLRAHPIEDVEVDDPGIAEDVDTPDDYRRLIT